MSDGYIFKRLKRTHGSEEDDGFEGAFGPVLFQIVQCNMCGYGIMLRKVELRGHNSLYMTPIKLTSIVLKLGLIGFPSALLTSGSMNFPISVTPALGTYARF